jgi:hypothetical protein
MASVSRINGFRPVKTVSGAPVERASQFVFCIVW